MVELGSRIKSYQKFYRLSYRSSIGYYYKPRLWTHNQNNQTPKRYRKQHLFSAKLPIIMIKASIKKASFPEVFFFLHQVRLAVAMVKIHPHTFLSSDYTKPASIYSIISYTKSINKQAVLSPWMRF